jgi:hypothetical protein
LAVGEKLSDCHSLFSTVTVLSPKLAQDKQKLSKSKKLKPSPSHGRRSASAIALERIQRA